MPSERSTPSELERAVREAWPGCEWDAEWSTARISAPGGVLCMYLYQDEDNTRDLWKCYLCFECRSDDGYASLAEPTAHTPTAAIAAAREQARGVLRGWLEEV